jgi:hypothetical protein
MTRVRAEATSAAPARAVPRKRTDGALTARALGNAVIEAVHVLSSPLNSLQLGVDVQGTLLERGRIDDARRNVTTVAEEVERVVELVRLMRDWAGACVALPDESVADRLRQPFRASADAHTRMFVDAAGDNWIGGRADGVLGFVVFVLVDIAFEQGAERVELDASRAESGAEITVRARLPANPDGALAANGRHAATRVRRVLLDGVLSAAGATLDARRDADWTIAHVRFPAHAADGATTA